MAGIQTYLDAAKKHFETLMSPEALKDREQRRLNAELWKLREGTNAALATRKLQNVGETEYAKEMAKPHMMDAETARRQFEESQNLLPESNRRSRINYLGQLARQRRAMMQSGTRPEELKTLDQELKRVMGISTGVEGVAKPTSAVDYTNTFSVEPGIMSLTPDIVPNQAAYTPGEIGPFQPKRIAKPSRHLNPAITDFMQGVTETNLSPQLDFEQTNPPGSIMRQFNWLFPKY
jgi:hypothetical protein